MENQLEFGLRTGPVYYSAIRPGRRKMRTLLERGLLFALAAAVALVVFRNAGVALGVLFSAVAAAI